MKTQGMSRIDIAVHGRKPLGRVPSVLEQCLYAIVTIELVLATFPNPGHHLIPRVDQSGTVRVFRLNIPEPRLHCSLTRHCSAVRFNSLFVHL